MTGTTAERHGPWAVIAGGSEGIGASIAARLGSQGINLALLARRIEPLEKTAQAVRDASRVEVRTLAADLSSPDVLDQVRAVTDDVEVGLYVHNTGGLFGNGPLVDVAPEDVMRTIGSMVAAPTTLTHHFARGMRERGRGGVLLVGSLAGAAGGPTRAMYSAGKAFTQSLAEGLWGELRPCGVDVAYLVVGSTDTPARRRSAGPVTPGQVVDDPDEIARFALDNLGDGPVLVPPRLVEGFTSLSSMPRREAVEAMIAMFSGRKSN